MDTPATAAAQPASPKFTITVSGDKMQATLEVAVPGENDPPVTAPDVMKKSEEMGIRDVDRPRVESFLRAGNFGGPLLLREGRPPKKGADGAVVYPLFEQAKEKKEDEFGRMDHREVAAMVFAKIGDLLAKKTPPTAGEDGVNVFGDPIPAEPGKEAPVSAGKNVQASADGLDLTATAAGHLMLEGTTLTVDPVLVCEGDVNFDVGNIDFDGAVCIRGSIHEGFTVKATGDITAQSISKANVTSGRNVVVEKGIIGSPETRITCKGDLSAKFMENAVITAGGSVTVSEVILHSTVSAGKHVIVRGGKHASIVGGHVHAAGCIEAKNFGSDAAVRTHLDIGLDPVIKEKLESLQKNMEKTKDTHDKAAQNLSVLVRLKERVRNLLPAKEAQFKQLKAETDQLAQDLQKIQKELAELLKSVETAKPGFISVKEKIFAGTRIGILDHVLNVDRPQSSIRYYLNREKKSIGTSDFKEVEA
ncbi:DUF342 domain-containing protein [bacterium]|nr:DUF342 domain-containing protein [bacterium]